jgi:hypothetical protein
MAFIQIILSLTNHRVHGETGLASKIGFKGTNGIICVILLILFQSGKGNSIVLTGYKRRDRKGCAEFAALASPTTQSRKARNDLHPTNRYYLSRFRPTPALQGRKSWSFTKIFAYSNAENANANSYGFDTLKGKE